MKKRKVLWGAIIILALCGSFLGWGWYVLDQRRRLPFPINGESVIGQRIYNEF